MKNLCQCGCGVVLRKDNKTGYQKGHKPCPVCGTLVRGSGIECCSKSCSAKLHWQRNPDMKDSRIWNADRCAKREKNKDSWIKNLSEACKGRIPWNKNTSGLQTAWNKGLPSDQQPRYNVKNSYDWYEKYKKTNLEKYGLENPGSLAKTTSKSKKEKLLEPLLLNYKTNLTIGKYKPDYVNEKTKHIVEVYGDYWHCNPNIYKENFYHPQLKITAQEKWRLDEIRKKYLESLGYTVTVVWEKDIKNFIKNYDLPH